MIPIKLNIIQILEKAYLTKEHTLMQPTAFDIVNLPQKLYKINEHGFTMTPTDAAALAKLKFNVMIDIASKYSLCTSGYTYIAETKQVSEELPLDRLDKISLLDTWTDVNTSYIDTLLDIYPMYLSFFLIYSIVRILLTQNSHFFHIIPYLINTQIDRVGDSVISVNRNLKETDVYPGKVYLGIYFSMVISCILLLSTVLYFITFYEEIARNILYYGTPAHFEDKVEAVTIAHIDKLIKEIAIEEIVNEQYVMNFKHNAENISSAAEERHRNLNMEITLDPDALYLQYNRANMLWTYGYITYLPIAQHPTGGVYWWDSHDWSLAQDIFINGAAYMLNDFMINNESYMSLVNFESLEEKLQRHFNYLYTDWQELDKERAAAIALAFSLWLFFWFQRVVYYEGYPYCTYQPDFDTQWLIFNRPYWVVWKVEDLNEELPPHFNKWRHKFLKHPC